MNRSKWHPRRRRRRGWVAPGRRTAPIVAIGDARRSSAGERHHGSVTTARVRRPPSAQRAWRRPRPAAAPGVDRRARSEPGRPQGHQTGSGRPPRRRARCGRRRPPIGQGTQTVPGQHLHLVQSGQVPGHVALDEPPAPHVEDAEGVPILLTPAAALPGLPRCQESPGGRSLASSAIPVARTWTSSSWGSSLTQRPPSQCSTIQWSTHLPSSKYPTNPHRARLATPAARSRATVRVEKCRHLPIKR